MRDRRLLPNPEVGSSRLETTRGKQRRRHQQVSPNDRLSDISWMPNTLRRELEFITFHKRRTHISDGRLHAIKSLRRIYTQPEERDEPRLLFADKFRQEGKRAREGAVTALILYAPHDRDVDLIAELQSTFSLRLSWQPQLSRERLPPVCIHAAAARGQQRANEEGIRQKGQKFEPSLWLRAPGSD